MSHDSIWPALACMAVLLLIANSPVFRAADAPPSPRRQRVSSIDGIRGLLAFGVYFHHVAITYPFLTRGVWTTPDSGFYRMLGAVAVDIFFMITGYLFWSKAIQERGRLNLLKLYIGRIFRIGPLYVFTICVMLVILGFKTNFHLREPFPVVLLESAEWLALGLVLPQVVNSYSNTNVLVAGVTWTLHYEWIFYFSLAFTSLLAGFKNRMLLGAAAAYCVCLFFLSFTEPSLPQATYLSATALFLSGMICASLEANHLLIAARPYAKSLAGLVLIVSILGGSWLPNTVYPLVLVLLFFYLIISGSTFFGLLTSRAAFRLGNISYGIYLLQGLALTVVFGFGPIRNVAISSPVAYWVLALLCAILLIGVATLTHVFIERPGIELGIRLSAVLTRKRDEPSPKLRA